MSEWKVCLCVFEDGGHNSQSIETDVVFSEEQANAIADLLQFVKDNNQAEYFTATTEIQDE